MIESNIDAKFESRTLMEDSEKLDACNKVSASSNSKLMSREIFWKFHAGSSDFGALSELWVVISASHFDKNGRKIAKFWPIIPQGATKVALNFGAPRSKPTEHLP